MNLINLAKLKNFFENVGGDISLDDSISDFNLRLILQKSGFILNEEHTINLFNLLGTNKNDFSWYIRGVYSKSLADAYYEIDTNKDILNHIIKNRSKEIEDNNIDLKKGKKLINFLKTKFKIKDMNRFKDILELYSSIIFLSEKKHLCRSMISAKIKDEKSHLDYLSTEMEEMFDFLSTPV